MLPCRIQVSGQKGLYSVNVDNVIDYIKKNWHRSIYLDEPGTGFGGVDLPFEYTSPCIKGEGHFYFFFYWDTYFTNVGLLRHGLCDTAKNNIKNMFYLIDRQGYMPNHVGIHNRSQPPYLCQMVKEYVAATGDHAFRQQALPYLRHEYNWWITARHTPTGLQRHGHHDTAEGCREFYGIQRIIALGHSVDASDECKSRVGGQFMAEAESGWDFCQRFDARCLDYNAVDLNGLLYSYETYLAEADAVNAAGYWQDRAAKRKEWVNTYLWSDEKGWFFDYDFVNHRHSQVYSLAAMLPLFTGLASAEQVAKMVGNLHVLERDHGIAVANELEGCTDYQWSYPNMWAPMVYLTVEGLRRYGYESEAKRIAQKFVDTSLSLFAETGRLWEKTNAETGGLAAGEYAAAPMLGWSAGVFVAMAEYTDNA